MPADVQAPAAQAAILGRLMLAFQGVAVPAWLEERLAAAPVAGFTLFRHLNVRSPGQVLGLTRALQAAAVGQAGGLPILIGVDQEGGQLLALGPGWTPFGGSMAIGAAGDAGLAERVGRAVGRELRAVGVNVDYAPCLDVASNPANPSLGIRSLGDDPAAAASLGTAWLRGLQSAGVAGTAKHFPGKGEGSVDTHLELAVVERDRAALDAVELRPFRAAVGDARLVMSGHFAVPALTGSRTLPSTLAPQVMTGLLRDELGFEGVSITDALDMGALPQDATQVVDVIAALAAGVDLLLATYRRASHRRIESAIVRAAQLGFLDPRGLAASAARIDALRRWIASFEPEPLEVVGCAEHTALAQELAERSITLVRDEAGLLPLRLGPGARIIVIEPEPFDLTPADTTSTLVPRGLAAAVRNHHDGVTSVVVAPEPSDAEVAAVRDAARGADLAIVATDAASFRPGQTALARAVIATGVPVVTVALRTPFDLAGYPEAATHACTFGRHEPSMAALAAALFGRTPFGGRLPAAVPGLYPTGHGLAAGGGAARG